VKGLRCHLEEGAWIDVPEKKKLSIQNMLWLVWEPYFSKGFSFFQGKLIYFLSEKLDYI
jgi:hypothetical protein